MKSLLTIFLAFTFLQAEAQKINPCNDCVTPLEEIKNCNSFFGQITLPENTTVANYLQTNIKNVSVQVAGFKTSFKQETIIQSPGGKHYSFIQTLNDIPVFLSQIKVNTNNKDVITSIFDNSHTIHSIRAGLFPDEKEIKQHIAKLYPSWDLEYTNIWFDIDNTLTPAGHILARKADTGQFRELIVDATANILYNKDLNHYFKATQDTVVNASVFKPDPLTSAGVTYGAPFKDYDDSDVIVLDNQMVNVKMNVTLVNDTFRLASPYAFIDEFSSPITVPAYSLSPNFKFNRSQVQFEDVNAYYHINTIQKHIQALGFSNIVNYQMPVDAHANNYDDNSMFSSAYPPGRLYFGQGGVDDAEDADVIAHEYGHAISQSAAPDTDYGTEREALDEANSDYFASSYSRFINPYHWDWVFSWDGHNEYWPGRFSTSTKHYPQDLAHNLYTDIDIWSSTMMQLWGDLGRDTTDKILIESLYGYAINMTMRDAAYLVLQADSAISGGKNTAAITQRMTDRGLFPAATVGITELALQHNEFKISSNIIGDERDVTISTSKPLDFQIQLMSIDGRVITTKNCNSCECLGISSAGLVPGLYLLKASADKDVKIFKWIKY